MMNCRSMAELFVKRVEASGDRLAFQFPGVGGNGWKSITWNQALERVRAIALGLHSLGLTREQRCSILASTRVEWILVDLGILCASGATTTIYPSNTAAECAYIINDSETKFVFAENQEQVEKLLEVRSQLRDVDKVIVIDGDGVGGDWVLSLADLEKKGRALHAQNPGLFRQIVDSVEKDDLATLVYTSGTTGQPKGVELVHECWVFEGNAIAKTGILGIDDHQYLWLPLSHVFGKVLEAAQLAIGFATTVDGRLPRLVSNLAEVRPTFMAAAPRIFEKVYNKVVTGAQSGSALKYKIFTWAIGVGRDVSQVRQRRGQPQGLLLVKYRIADKLVFSKLKARFGGRIRFFVSGSAPLSREMAEFFHASDILILEGYGLTESSAASFVNVPATFKFGTVGHALEGVEVKIAESDGEVLLRGPHIMRGYHNQPEATREALSEDGWLRTGDIGELDSEGRLRITDRKKDLIKTSGGKYVAPQALEGRLKSLCPYISQVVVHGDKRNYVTALVTIDPESIEGWKGAHGLTSVSYEELTQRADVRKFVQDAIQELNDGLAPHEAIKKFAVLSRDFTVEDGELTASMKVKRKAVEKKYANVLDGFYAESVAHL